MDEDIIFEDDSDCPSAVSTGGSDASIHSEEDLDAQMGLEDDDEDEALQKEWSEAAVGPEVKIFFDDVDRLFFDKMKSQVSEVRTKIKHRWEGDYSTQDKEMMSEEVKFFNSFASPELWLHLQSMANKNLPTGQDKVTPREIELSVRLLFAQSVYNVPLDRAEKSPKTYPLVTNVLKCFIGGKERARTIQKALDCVKMIEEDYGDSWDEPFALNKDMQKLERTVSERCSEIAFKAGSTDLTIDDDKMRNRSWLSALLGWVRSKGLKSFGPVNNILGNFPLGLFCASSMTAHGESSLDSTRRLLRRVCAAEEDKAVDMKGSLLHGDRGYEGDENVEFAAQAKLGTLNTVKRGPSLAHKFGETKYKTQKKQREISEQGPRTAFAAKRKLGDKIHNLVVYRSGTGRCVLLSTTEPGMDAANWTVIPKVPKDLRDWVEGKLQTDSKIKEFLDEQGCVQLTVTQRDSGWFLLRQFRFTSTTAVQTLHRLLKDDLTNEEEHLLKEEIGLDLKTGEEQSPAEKYAEYIAMNTSELEKLTKTKLKEIVKAFKVVGRSKMYTDKHKMAVAIKQGPSEHDAIERTEFEAFVRSSFLKPLDPKKRPALALGTASEGKVLDALPKFLNSRTECGIRMGSRPKEIGLVARKSKKQYATSMDACSQDMEIREQGGQDGETWIKPDGVPVEIKYLSSKKSMDAMEKAVVEVDAQGRRFARCQFGDATFKKVVSNTGYRVQLLHHAMVSQVDHVLFVVAYAGRIRFCLLVDVPLMSRKVYENLLDKYVAEHLDPIYGDAELPTMTEKNLSVDRKYRIEPDTVKLNLALWKKMNEKIEEKTCPLPALRQFLPRIVCWWNAAKGVIDVLSRYLKHCAIPFHSVSPAFVLLVRLLFLLAINGCLTKRLLAVDFDQIGLEKEEHKSYRWVKHNIANELPLIEFFESLADNFRLPTSVHGGENPNDRQQFSPRKRRRVVEEDLVEGEASEDDMHALSSILTQLKEGKKKAISYVDTFQNNEVAKRVRLSKCYGHQVVDRRAQQGPRDQSRCVLCSQKAPTDCPVCGVHLCIKRPEDGDACSEIFHDATKDLLEEYDKRHGTNRRESAEGSQTSTHDSHE